MMSNFIAQVVVQDRFNQIQQAVFFQQAVFWLFMSWLLIKLFHYVTIGLRQRRDLKRARKRFKELDGTTQLGYPVHDCEITAFTFDADTYRDSKQK